MNTEKPNSSPEWNILPPLQEELARMKNQHGDDFGMICFEQQYQPHLIMQSVHEVVLPPISSLEKIDLDNDNGLELAPILNIKRTHSDEDVKCKKQKKDSFVIHVINKGGISTIEEVYLEPVTKTKKLKWSNVSHESLKDK